MSHNWEHDFMWAMLTVLLHAPPERKIPIIILPPSKYHPLIELQHSSLHGFMQQQNR